VRRMDKARIEERLHGARLKLASALGRLEAHKDVVGQAEHELIERTQEDIKCAFAFLRNAQAELTYEE